MPNPDLRKLYDAAAEVYDPQSLGDFEHFRTKIGVPENRRKFYDDFAQHYELEDFDEFNRKVDRALSPAALLPIPKGGKLAPPKRPETLTALDPSLLGSAKRMAAGFVETAGQIPGGFESLNRLGGRISKEWLKFLGVPEQEVEKEFAPYEQRRKGAAKEISQATKKFSKEYIGAKPDFPKDIEALVRNPLGVGPRLALETIPMTAILAGLTAINPAAGSAIIYGIEAGETEQAFNELEESGVKIDPIYRDVAVIGKGALNAALEKVGIDKILQRVPGGKSQIFKILSSTGTEGITEAAQEINAILAETGAQLTPDQIRDIKTVFDASLNALAQNSSRIQEAGLGGAIGGAGASVITEGKRSLTENAVLNKISRQAYGKSFGNLETDQQEEIRVKLDEARKRAASAKVDQATEEIISQPPEAPPAAPEAVTTPTTATTPTTPTTEAPAKPKSKLQQQLEARRAAEAELNTLAKQLAPEAFGRPFAELTPDQQKQFKDEIKAEKDKSDAAKRKQIIAKAFAPKEEAEEKPVPTSKAQPEPSVTAPALQPEAPAVIAAEEAPAPTEEKPREFSSTQTPLPKDVSSKVVSATEKIIDKEDVHPVEGLEKEPHITVKFGLHTNDAGEVQKLLVDEKPIQAKIEGIEIFKPENEDYDVVVARVSSDDLTRLNKKIVANIENTETQPSYKPHITLGYVKKGTGEKYAKAQTGLEGQTITLDTIEFSGKDRKITPIKLGGEKAPVLPTKTTEPAKTEAAPVTEPTAPRPAPKAKDYEAAQVIFDKAIAEASEKAKTAQVIEKGETVTYKGKPYKVTGVLPNGKIQIKAPKTPAFAIDKSRLAVKPKGGREFTDAQQKAARTALEAANVHPTIIKELTEPERAPRPFEPETGKRAELTTRTGRIERAIEPPANLKPQVDAIADAAVDFRNKEAAYEQAKKDIIAEIEERGGEVVVNAETGAFTIKLQPGKLGLASTIALKKLRAEAAEAGAYSLATVGRGFEIAGAPEKIAAAEPLKGTFAEKAKEFVRRSQAVKAADKAYSSAKKAAQSDLVDHYLAERAAGREPRSFKGVATDGTAVEVMARRQRSAIEPDIAAGGRDFPAEIKAAKEAAPKQPGEPFLATYKTGKKKIEKAKKMGSYVAEEQPEYEPRKREAIPDEIVVDGEKRPTRNSEGRLIHSTIKGVENFWTWFDGSKIVDAQGRPQVVYHQTNRLNEPSIKEKGFDISPEKARARRSDSMVPNGIFFKPTAKDIGVGTNIPEYIAQIPVYLKITNPVETRTADTIVSQLARIDEDAGYDLFLAQKNAKDEDEEWSVEFERREKSAIENRADRKAWTEFKEWANDYLKRWEENNRKNASVSRAIIDDILAKNGYDGVIIEDDIGSFGRKTKTFVALKPTQVKSSTENIGTYSPTEPSILREAESPYIVGEPDSETFPESARDQEKAIADLQKPYEPTYDKRPDASEKTDRDAKAAVENIGVNRRRGRVLLANAISAEAREKGTVSLVGKEVRTSDDVAALAQVYRDPRWETLRYVFVKGGKVVHVTGVSSRLPASTKAFPFATDEDGYEWLRDLMFATEADGYYMLHNHPSGDVEASWRGEKNDLTATMETLKAVPGFKGHVIIDSNKYNVVTYNAKADKLNEKQIEKFFGEEKLLVPSKASPVLGQRLDSAEKLARIGLTYKAPKGWVTLVSHSAAGVRGMMEVESAVMKNPKRAAAIVRRFARQTGAGQVFLVGDQSFYDKYKNDLGKAIKDGFLHDAISTRGYSVREELRKKKELPKPEDRKQFGIRPSLQGRELGEGVATEPSIVREERAEYGAKAYIAKFKSAKDLGKAIRDIVIDYKENPTVGDVEKVKQLKKKLLTTPEGKLATQISQENLAKIADKNGMITVFRGSAADAEDSDAGWSSSIYDALNFALKHSDGEIVIAKAPLADVLYYDSSFGQKHLKFNDEGEIIFKDIFSAESFKRIDVSQFAEEYSDLGYPPTEAENFVDEKIGQFKNADLSPNIDEFFNKSASQSKQSALLQSVAEEEMNIEKLKPNEKYYLRFTEAPDEDLSRKTSVHIIGQYENDFFKKLADEPSEYNDWGMKEITEDDAKEKFAEQYDFNAENLAWNKEHGWVQVLDGLSGFEFDNWQDAIKAGREGVNQYSGDFSIYIGKPSAEGLPDGDVFHPKKIAFKSTDKTRINELTAADETAEKIRKCR